MFPFLPEQRIRKFEERGEQLYLEVIKDLPTASRPDTFSTILQKALKYIIFLFRCFFRSGNALIAIHPFRVIRCLDIRRTIFFQETHVSTILIVQFVAIVFNLSFQVVALTEDCVGKIYARIGILCSLLLPFLSHASFGTNFSPFSLLAGDFEKAVQHVKSSIGILQRIFGASSLEVAREQVKFATILEAAG